ncbi:hypothetical protein NJ76_23165 [Rhodococcus sp. IITR03]|nr:hypothetical protein NJ76_23165 [Rhodococcus sp. IITR03]
MVAILEFVARAEGSVRLADMVNELDAPRSSVHGLVHGLASSGYLRATEDGRYTLGAAINALLMHQSSLDHGIRSAMETLNLEFDETVALVVIAGDSIVTTSAIESSKAVRYNPTIGVRRPLYPTSAGKCFLANASEAYREKYLKRSFGSKRHREEVRADLEKVLADGFAINLGDTLPDLRAVSVPVFDGQSVSAVLTVGGPTSRFTDKLDAIVNSACEAAAHASKPSR